MWIVLQRSEGQSYALKQQLAQMEDEMSRETELLRAEVVSTQHDLKLALQVRLNYRCNTFIVVYFNTIKIRQEKRINTIIRSVNISDWFFQKSAKYLCVLSVHYICVCLLTVCRHTILYCVSVYRRRTSSRRRLRSWTRVRTQQKVLCPLYTVWSSPRPVWRRDTPKWNRTTQNSTLSYQRGR